jgi:hypothetical protein
MRFMNSNAGGGGGNPASQQAGAANPSQTAAEDPYAGLDLDDLDPEVRARIEKSREQFATLQKEHEKAQQVAMQRDAQARKWQADYDRAMAQIKKVGGDGHPADEAAEADKALIAKMEQQLIQGGVSAEQAKIQAPIMTGMMKVYGQELKAQIGQDLAPFAGSVMQQEATNSWNVAMQQDKLGVLQIPEVANKVWQGVQSLIQQGQPVNPGVVTSLKHMAYAEHLEANGPINQQQQQQQQQQPPQFPVHQQQPPAPSYPNFGGGMSYPGAGAAPQLPAQHNPNAPRTSLNSDTHAALLATFGKMGKIPKGLGGK